jgi:hypothetical protein
VDGEGAISRRSSERMAREPCHGEVVSVWRGSHFTARQRVDDEGAMSRRGSEWMATEPCHGEVVSGWRLSHFTARQ